MTIFMGYRSEDYVFGVIDSRMTDKTVNQTNHFDYQRKVYTLKNYNISYATTGRVLETTPDVRLGTELTDEIDKTGTTKTYNEVIQDIITAYRTVYDVLVTDNGTSNSILSAFS
ncbi:hypothetical protein SOP94_17355 [Peribacillus frigoritolerans]|uniref:hypothetical protein n=1 Tax=Peribacillus frigoritolerans TaxID=450367 RepID=UPI002B24242A|nr:hypothetical protein [Peribacillus frigoritolerans]MEB2630225.1 hypothetical protein [Peribacillus frigoritolerans]